MLGINRNSILITILMLSATTFATVGTQGHEHFTGSYAHKSTPYWAEVEVIHSDDGYMLTIPGDSKWKVPLKPSGQTLVGEDEGMAITLSYDSTEKCYHMEMSHSKDKELMQMIKLVENPSEKLEKKYGVKAADLVRNVRKSEDWIHQVKTMKIIATDKWTKTPEGIEHRKKEIKQRNPAADLSLSIWNLEPVNRGKVEVFFDEQRYGYRKDELNKKEALWIWNGKEIVGRIKYLKNDIQEYVFRKDMGDHNTLLTEFMWPRSRHHEFYWQKEKMPDWPDWYGKPEDFILVGTEIYRGKKCYILESCPKSFGRIRRWFVGIDDGFRYGEIVIESGEISNHNWTGNYKEVMEGWWFPTVQGYHNLKRDENGKRFIASTRNINIEDVEINNLLSDDLFVIEFEDGVKTTDDRFGGFISYKWKNSRTEKGWQELRDKAGKRTKKECDEKAKIDAWIGKKAIEFSVGSQWVNTEPLTMEKLRGKAVILQFWGTWCGPCHNYMDSLKKGDENARIIVIGVHTPENNLDVIRKDMKKYKSDGPVCIEVSGESGISKSGIIAGAYQVRMRPYWVVIGPDGKVAGHSKQIQEVFELARKLTVK